MGKNRKEDNAQAQIDFEDDGSDVGEYIPVPPDGGWGWMVVLASFICNLFVDGIVYSFGIFLTEFMGYFDEPRSKVSLVGSLLVGVYLCAGPVVGGLVNKFGCRIITIIGSVISTIAFLLAMFSPNIDILIITYGVMAGFGFGMIYLPSIVSVGFYFERNRALATGMAVCGSGIGTFIFSPLSKYLLDEFDWKNAVWILAGIAFNGCVCGMLIRPLEVPEKYKSKKSRIKKSKKSDQLLIGTREENGENDRKPSADAGKTNTNREARLRRQESTEDEPRGTDVTEARSADTGDQDGGEHDDNANGYSTSNSRKNKQDDGANVHLLDGIHGHEVTPGERHHRSAADELISRTGVHTGSRHLLGSSHSISEKDYARPMYRKDIFYSGSIVNIHEYKSQEDVADYVRSITSIPEAAGRETWIEKCCSCLPKPVVDVLAEMMDVSLFKNVAFILVCLGNILVFMGYFVPYVYLVDRAVLSGVDRTQASFLLSVLGITNTIGRIVSGILADREAINSLMLNNVCMLIAGIDIVIMPFCRSYATLVVTACIFGLCTAAIVSLTSIVICDLLGLGKLTNALGLLSMARGIASIAGPPLAGAVFQKTGNYDASFFLGGGLFLIGTFLHFLVFIPCIRRGTEMPGTTVQVNDDVTVTLDNNGGQNIGLTNKDKTTNL